MLKANPEKKDRLKDSRSCGDSTEVQRVLQTLWHCTKTYDLNTNYKTWCKMIKEHVGSALEEQNVDPQLKLIFTIFRRPCRPWKIYSHDTKVLQVAGTLLFGETHHNKAQLSPNISAYHWKARRAISAFLCFLESQPYVQFKPSRADGNNVKKYVKIRCTEMKTTFTLRKTLTIECKKIKKQKQDACWLQ